MCIECPTSSRAPNLECGDVTPLSFVSPFSRCFEIRNRKTKESGVTSPHSKLKKPGEDSNRDRRVGRTISQGIAAVQT
jgi:hypothetical protein